MIDASTPGEGLVPGERALREGGSVDRHHAERCGASASQLQKVATADIDASLTFGEPACFNERIHIHLFLFDPSLSTDAAAS